MTHDRSLFRYPGSKWRLMPRYVELFPVHDHYVSVFGGGANDLLRKPRSERETLNDLDPRIWNLFRVLQDERLTSQLITRISVPHCRLLYYDALKPDDALKFDNAPIDDPVEAAASFLIVTGQGMCLSHRRRNRKSAWTPHRLRHHLTRWLNLPDTIRLAQKRLHGVDVQNQSWSTIIPALDSPHTFFFLDPPYYMVDPWYAFTMSPCDHWEMLKVLLTIKGRVMLCGYRNSLYNGLLSGWYRNEFDSTTTLCIQGIRVKKQEVIWCNYDPHTTPRWTP